jgi:crotonobetainyl-CoA:carnitine CoA-transferase CaiB-like acyl-CoA transferase
MRHFPLEGYRVIDFGWAAAAPRATCLLADMGAEVIKVETRKRPDPVRFGPDNLKRDPEMDPLFHSINRNKLGILLDLTHSEGIELIKRLVRISDVVVENFSTGVMKRFTHIEVAQIESLLSTMPEPVMEFSTNKRILSTLGNVNNIIPVHNNYPCKGEDKWVSLAICTEEEWERFCKAIGDPPWTKREEFADGYKRSLNRKELDGLIGEWTIEKTPNEVMEILQKAGVAAAPCADTEDRFLDPHFQERQNIVNVDHPVTGVDFVPNVICKLSETPGEIRRPAPLLGEHNDYVYGELLGLSKDEIERLIQEKIIF